MFALLSGSFYRRRLHDWLILYAWLFHYIHCALFAVLFEDAKSPVAGAVRPAHVPGSAESTRNDGLGQGFRRPQRFHGKVSEPRRCLTQESAHYLPSISTI